MRAKSRNGGSCVSRNRYTINKLEKKNRLELSIWEDNMQENIPAVMYTELLIIP